MNVSKMLCGTMAVLWLVGCASIPRNGQAFDSGSDGYKTSAQKKVTSLPKHLKTRTDVIYSTLVGDIAAQRGNYDIAERHYVYAAKAENNAGLAELATRAALAAQNYATAMEQVTNWLRLEPEQIEAIQIAALLAAQQNDVDNMVAYLERLIKVHNAAGENGYLEAIRLLERIGKDELSLALGKQLIKDHMADPQALFALAILETGARNFTTAEQLVRKVLKLRPEWDEAKLLLIRTLKAQNNTLSATNTIKDFISAKPNDSKLRSIYARLLVEQNDLQAAKKQFEYLYKDNPKDGDALFALSMLSLQLKNPDEGKKYLERLYDMGTHKDDAAFYLGQILEEDGNTEEALTWYARVETGNRFEAQLRVARIRAKQGSVSKAREILQQIRSQISKDAVQMDLIEAEILREVKQYKAALTVLTEALKNNQDSSDLLYAHALTAVHLGQIDVLERDLKLVIAKNPNHAEALNALGYTLAAETDRYEEALGYIQRALAIKPDNPAILDSMGWINYKMGNTQEALVYLKQALKLLPDPEIAAHLGEVLWAIGNKDQALKVWQEAFKKEPDSEHILKIQEQYGIKF